MTLQEQAAGARVILFQRDRGIQGNVMKDFIHDIGMSFLVLKYAVWTSPVKTALTTIGGFLAVFFAPIGPFLAAVGVLVILDIITGVQAAKKRKEKITSSGYKAKVSDMIAYVLLIIGCETIVQVFFKGVPVAEGLTYSASLFISGVELKSIAENVEEITGLSVWDNIKHLFKSKTKTNNGE